MIELRTHEGFPTGALRSEWEMLVDEVPDATIFHTPRYLQVWHEQLGRRVTPYVRTVHRDGRLVGIVPEAHERIGSPTGPTEVRSFLGGADVTDYCGPIARAEDRDDVAARYLETLVDDVDWDELSATGLAEDTGWADALVRNAERVGLEVLDVADVDVCPRVALSGGYDAYLGTLPSKQRHELKRKERKLARDAGAVELQRVPADELSEQLEVFFDMAADTQTPKSGFFQRDELRAFFRALAGELGADGTFRLHLLHVGGKPGAAAVSLVHGREWNLYNSAFDQTLRTLAPGMVLVSGLIREAADDSCAVFDLLRGDEPYKYRFGAESRAVQRVTITRR